MAVLSSSGIVGFEHGYDRRNNRTSENKFHDPVNSETYQYDSAYRLQQFDRPDPGAIAPIHGVWDLDGVGNWLQVDGETRMHSSFNEIIETDDGAITTYQYDDNGNQINEGFLYEWDSRNRLRTVTRKGDGASIATYTYDAFNRRVSKAVSNSGPLDGVTNYYYDGWRVIEERNGADDLVQQYVYGRSLDEPLILDRNLDGGDDATEPGDQRLFYHQNALGSTFALTDIVGDIVEGYQYDAYGRQTVYEPGPNGVVEFGGDDIVAPGGTSTVGNPYMFTGRRLDPETGLYYYRNRYYNPEQGRFIHRDPTGYRDGMGLYGYGLNNPINVTDSLGLKGSKSDGTKQVYASKYEEAVAQDLGKNKVIDIILKSTAKALEKEGKKKAAQVVTGPIGAVVAVGDLVLSLGKMTSAFDDYFKARTAAVKSQLAADLMGRKLKHAETQQAQQEKIDKIGRAEDAREEAFRRENRGDPGATTAREREQQRRNSKLCGIFFGGGGGPSLSYAAQLDLSGPRMMHGMPQVLDLDIEPHV